LYIFSQPIIILPNNIKIYYSFPIQNEEGFSIKSYLNEILVCPICRIGPLNLKTIRANNQEILEGELSCPSCRKSHSIKDGIPFLHPHPEISQTTLDNYERLTSISDRVEGANIAYHNLKADEYETDYTTNYIFEDNCQNRISEIISNIKEKTDGRYALDIGCGTGNILKYTTKIFERAIGLDLSIKMLEKSRKYGAELVQGTGVQTPFADNQFDLVTCFSVLHHICEPLALIQEIHRILKKGGILYTDWDFNSFFYWKPLHSLWMHRMNIPEALGVLLKHKLIPNKFRKAFEVAEYHVFNEWINPDLLKQSMINGNFCNVEIIFHWNSRSIYQISQNGREKLMELFKTLISFNTDPKQKNPIFIIIAQK